QVCAWTCNTPLDRAGATARRHHPDPAEAHRRWRGKRSEPVRLGIRAHTHALFALKVQRKVSNGIAGLAADGASLDPQKSRPNSRLTAMPLDGQRRRITLAEERHFPSGAAQTRIVSAARIRLDPPKSTRLFKGLICGDICEFESSHPSHAVGSLWRVYPVHGLCEQRRSLLTGARSWEG